VPFRSRPFGGIDDLRRMQALASTCWRHDRPAVKVHPGDLSWWMFRHEEAGWDERIRLWFDAAASVDSPQPAGWAWFAPPDGLDHLIAPDHRGGPLLDEMLTWLDDRARTLAAPLATVTPLPSVAGDDPGAPDRLLPSAVHAWSLEGDEAAGTTLRAAGFEPDDEGVLEHLVRTLAGPVPGPLVPADYTIRPMRGPEDLEARVEVHRAAFAPSRVTVRSYRALMASPGYRADLDVVVVAPDGTFAAFALGWYDAASGGADLEPVGTHPDHRRRGLARAACLAALRAAQRLGATECVIYSWATNDSASSLYESMGFRVATRSRAFTRELRR